MAAGLLGNPLRELRERRGMSLDEIAKTTRISKGQLEALEAEDFDDLPAPVFVRGFIRAYCECVGAAPDEALARYRSLLSGHDPPRAPAPRLASAPGRRAIVAAAVLLVVLALAFAGLRLLVGGGSLEPAGRAARDRAASPSGSTASPGQRGHAVTTPPAGGVGEREPRGEASGAQGAGPQRLLVRTTELTWLKVQMDGETTIQELLPPGVTREWTADRRFVLTVGNAGGIEIELNGLPMPPLGASGTVIRQLVLPPGAPPS
jgi:cytoskeleton protein RodZ